MRVPNETETRCGAFPGWAKAVSLLLSGAFRTSGLVLALLPAQAMAAPREIAVAPFVYTDTSGEPRDQRAEHEARLAAFGEQVRADLEGDGGYHVTLLGCGAKPCSDAGASPDELLDDARKAGAGLLVVGGVHKMSTLIQWVKVAVLDVGTKRVLLDKLITFRGDSDEAWSQSAHFLARQIREADLPR